MADCSFLQDSFYLGSIYMLAVFLLCCVALLSIFQEKAGISFALSCSSKQDDKQEAKTTIHDSQFIPGSGCGSYTARWSPRISHLVSILKSDHMLFFNHIRKRCFLLTKRLLLICFLQALIQFQEPTLAGNCLFKSVSLNLCRGKDSSNLYSSCPSQKLV